MSDIITVNKKDIALLKDEAGKLIIKQRAEESLVALLDLKDFIDGIVEEVKKQIAVSGKQAYPDFKGIQGEKIKAVYRAFGDRYGGNNPAYTKQIITERLDVEKIDEYKKGKGKLPTGIFEKERTEKLIITRYEKKQEPLKIKS